MTIVRDGIVEGTKRVVMDLALEEKYQRAALMSMQDGMRMISMVFD
jgi:hypothetical protein